MNKDISKWFIGLDEKTKLCTKCFKECPVTAFAKGSGGNYLRHECRNCAKSQANIVQTLKKQFGSPPKNYICPICKRTENEITLTSKKKNGVWCLDHDHKTNVFRGWICQKCNLGLGNMNDDISRLEAAIEYLKRHKGE